MNDYWKYVLFPNFLAGIQDDTFSEMTDADLTTTLNTIVKNALQRFKFSKVGLDYSYDDTNDPLDSTPYGFYFNDTNIGDAEYQVIIAYMKVIWIDYQIATSRNFSNPFFDKDIKGYSPANMLTAMKNLKESYKKDAIELAFDYNRVGDDNKSALGKING